MYLSNERSDGYFLAKLASAENVAEGASKVAAEETVNA